MRGFALIYAIVILLITSTLSLYIIELNSQIFKQTTDYNAKTQLNLYMQSAINQSKFLLKKDHQGNSKFNIIFEDEYEFNVSTRFIDDSNSSVLIDIVGRYEIDEPIVIFRRDIF
jgi:type II secretory pathway component PulJ